jgi:hypothetical protein
MCHILFGIIFMLLRQCTSSDNFKILVDVNANVAYSCQAITYNQLNIRLVQ